jgi:repressor LexA
MTKRQKQCLDFISQFWERNGYGPSYQEISDGLGVKSRSGAYRLVDSLCKRGFLIRHVGHARSICLPGKSALRDTRDQHENPLA